jgi:serine/threonine protein kinase
MPRYKVDLHSIIKNGRLSRKHFLIIASQIIDVLKHLHEKHYVHSDIKSENIMIGLYDHTSSSTSASPSLMAPITNGYSKKSVKKANSPPPPTTTSSASIQFSGANPLRSCRMKDGRPDKSHHMVYNDMVQSHYLRPGRSVVSYAMDENSRSSHALESDENNDDSDEDEDFAIGSKGTCMHTY